MGKRMFNTIDEYGRHIDSELLTIFALPSTNERYAIYTAPEEGTSNVIICASLIKKDQDNKDILIDLRSEEEKNEIINIVKQMILNGESNNETN